MNRYLDFENDIENIEKLITELDNNNNNFESENSKLTDKKNKLFQKNIEVLKSNGSKFLGPCEGEMACGEYGMGRMMEPQQIIKSLV